jgi:predicted nucleotidyltransferase
LTLLPKGPFKFHKVALEVAEKLIKDPKVKALALTGSVARGDAGPASDVDFWVLGNRNTREVLPNPAYTNVDVTLLWQTPKRALEDDTLLRFEVEDAFVLHDPDGLFRKVRAAFWERREALREVMIHDTAYVISDLIMNAQRQTIPRAVALLREAGRRSAAMRIYLDFGWRVPKWRHFDHHLQRSALARLRALQSFPEEGPSWRRLIKHLRTHQFGFRTLQQSTDAFPPPLPTLEKAKWLSQKGHREEALSLIRQSLERVAFGKKAPGPVVELWQLAHGFDQRPSVPGDMRRTAKKCASLIKALKIESAIDADWRLFEKLEKF